VESRGFEPETILIIIFFCLRHLELEERGGYITGYTDWQKMVELADRML